MKYTTYMVTVGIDEVGRGCWAGPLVAGAVILRSDIKGLDDSKRLSKLRREPLAARVQAEAIVGLGWVEPTEIDSIGLSKSVGLAMERALRQITVDFDEIIIDGNINYFPQDARARAVIKADSTVPAVSAASIVAKVARDDYMSTEAHKLHPEYEFCKHVGYGTKLHMEMLKLHGVSPMHRKSYKPIMELL